MQVDEEFVEDNENEQDINQASMEIDDSDQSGQQEESKENYLIDKELAHIKEVIQQKQHPKEQDFTETTKVFKTIKPIPKNATAEEKDKLNEFYKILLENKNTKTIQQ